MAATAAAFANAKGFGNFTDSRGLAAGAGKAAGMLFAVALPDASVIGAFAVSLATSYALGDVLGLKTPAPGCPAGQGVLRGIRTADRRSGGPGGHPRRPPRPPDRGVQVLAGVLLPSASLFLLLCNDRDVLGPWVNGKALNAFTSAVVVILVTLSVILTASVLFPAITAAQIGAITAGCGTARPSCRPAR